MEQRQIILHIGLHKTGTSSFQAVMREHESDFIAAGIAPYLSPTGKTHSKEISLAILRDGVIPTPDKDRLFEKVKQQIAAFASQRTEQKLLFSSEHYSLIRTEAEAARIRGLFPDENLRFVVILVKRDRDAWLSSYRNQVVQSGIAESQNPDSAYYFGKDTWLTDFDTLCDVFARSFDELIVLNYDTRDIISPLLDVLGVKANFRTTAYRRNQASVAFKLGPLPASIARALVGTEHRGPLRVWRRLRERLLR